MRLKPTSEYPNQVYEIVPDRQHQDWSPDTFKMLCAQLRRWKTEQGPVEEVQSR